MINKNLYALLVGVGDYKEMNTIDLATYKTDVNIMRAALVNGLKAPTENIRALIGTEDNGFVSVADLAKAIIAFEKLLGEEDTFIFYFTGHGGNKNLVFSDKLMELQSVIDYIDKLSAKNKIVILDCCYSGDFVTAGAREMQFEESVADFAGHGIAVMASSAADELSRFETKERCSVFTFMLSSAMMINTGIRKGLLSLPDINDEVQRLMKKWNMNNPEKTQHPIFRSSMGGMIYFPVEEYRPYKQKEICRETVSYKIVKVKPLSSGKYKRLSAFVIPQSEVKTEDLARITKEIAETIKYEKIYSSQASENRFKGTPARAIWCYFGKDETDIVNSVHFAYTIWVADVEMKRLYFRPNKNAQEQEGIYIWKNTSYDLVKKLQEPTMSRQEFIEANKRLLVSIVSLAEIFIVDMQEVANQTISMDDMQTKYSNWIKEVEAQYLKLTDLDVAPTDLHDWSAEIDNLAGRILDMSIWLANDRGNGVIGEREIWLIKDSIACYRISLEKLKGIEKNIVF